MKAYAILAEYASYHRDGTFSVVRGGIDRIWGPTVPVRYNGALLVRIYCQITEAGMHDFEIKLTNIDGNKEIMPRLSGQFNAPTGGGYVNFSQFFGIAFPEFGEYVFVVRINKQESELLHINVVEQKEDVR